MHINQIFLKDKPTFSFEFFPPQTRSQAEILYENITRLTPLAPSFISITYGAGGSTRELTHDLVLKLNKEEQLTVIPHLTCIGHRKSELKQMVNSYRTKSIKNIMTLRGDIKSTDGKTAGDFDYASQLVRYIKKNFPEMGIGVAGYPNGHPETPNRLQEMDYLKHKVDQGADFICTQLFYDNHNFFDFQERIRLAGIKIPLIAGLMPLTSIKMMKKMSKVALGTHIPGKLQRIISQCKNQQEVQSAGIDWSTAQVENLLRNQVDGIHFYTLNRSQATLQIYKNLEL
ncbi:MAG: methylenetetrahydrofolate reductase [NAD(P)H] [Deltaproteobacteria bacterium]|jgi:methylenetetrahydrofolate reductase (NADPH)|nr:methylenetetrahydrofolate reductase [NAD(P)H] [Deltaproteobacteria bacterium]